MKCPSLFFRYLRCIARSFATWRLFPNLYLYRFAFFFAAPKRAPARPKGENSRALGEKKETRRLSFAGVKSGRCAGGGIKKRTACGREEVYRPGSPCQTTAIRELAPPMPRSSAKAGLRSPRLYCFYFFLIFLGLGIFDISLDNLRLSCAYRAYLYVLKLYYIVGTYGRKR